MTSSEILSGVNIALAEKHLQIWSERDADGRLEIIKEVYAEDIRLISPSDVITGSEAVNNYIAQQQTSFPGFRFKATNAVAAHHNAAQVNWQCGPETDPYSVTGVDVLQIQDRKIQGITIFINEKEQGEGETTNIR